MLVPVTPAMLFWWLLRPVSRAVRLGEHSALVWKLVYSRPPAASLSMVGVWIPPPIVDGSA